MLILSQDKQRVVNMDGIAEIALSSLFEQGFTPINIEILARIVGASDMVRIGEYKTRERAMEVINQIIEESARFCCADGGSFMFEPPKVYRMPEE